MRDADRYTRAELDAIFAPTDDLGLAQRHILTREQFRKLLETARYGPRFMSGYTPTERVVSDNVKPYTREEFFGADVSQRLMVDIEGHRVIVPLDIWSRICDTVNAARGVRSPDPYEEMPELNTPTKCSECGAPVKPAGVWLNGEPRVEHKEEK